MAWRRECDSPAAGAWVGRAGGESEAGQRRRPLRATWSGERPSSSRATPWSGEQPASRRSCWLGGAAASCWLG